MLQLPEMAGAHLFWQRSKIKRLHLICRKAAVDGYFIPPRYSLIIRKSRFIKLFAEEIQNLLQEAQISSFMADKVLTKSLMLLREMQMIYQKYRKDCKWGRAVLDYPVYRLGRINGGDNRACNTEIEPVIQFNIWHPCVEILKERMNNQGEEEGDIDLSKWEYIDADRTKLYKIRKAFIGSKSLYRE